MNTETKGGWRLFWMPFAAGWALFAFQAATNFRLATPVSPMGILDHQSAGTAARVDAIQTAWREAGVLGFAQLSMHLDLLFIALVTLGGMIGCTLVARRAPVPALKVFAWMTALAWGVFAVADFTETFSQILQATSAGSDQLAGLAASVGLVKSAACVIGTIDLVIALLWLRAARAKAV